MTFQSLTRVCKSRKQHRCSYCGGSIAAGSMYYKIAGKCDGDFTFARGHQDCCAMWEEAYSIWRRDGELMDFRLQEACDDTDALLMWRGKYPHVICRIELGWQKADLRWAADLAERGYPQDPSEYLGGNQ